MIKDTLYDIAITITVNIVKPSAYIPPDLPSAFFKPIESTS